MPDGGIHRDPDDVTARRDPRHVHQTSEPPAGPVSTSACRFDSVTASSRSPRLGGRTDTGSTSRPPSTSRISTGEPSMRPTSSANDLGILTARLLPHRWTLVFTATSPVRYLQ